MYNWRRGLESRRTLACGLFRAGGVSGAKSADKNRIEDVDEDFSIDDQGRQVHWHEPGICLVAIAGSSALKLNLIIQVCSPQHVLKCKADKS